VAEVALCCGPYSGYLGGRLCQHLAPAPRGVLGILGCHHGSRLRCHELGERRRSTSSPSVDMGASATLGDLSGHDDHHVAAQRSNSVAVAGKQFGALDAAGAWHFSRRNQSSILGNHVSWRRHGAFGAGYRLVQTVGTLSDLGGRTYYRTWHCFLATPGQKHACHRISTNRGLIPDK